MKENASYTVFFDGSKNSYYEKLSGTQKTVSNGPPVSLASYNAGIVIIKSKNNTGFLFIQPEAKYSILFPEKDEYTAYRPEGNQVEV